MNPAWVRTTREGVTLTLHVQPGAKRSEIVGEHGEALKIRLAAPPVDGKANARLIEFLADRLGIAVSRLELVAGHTSRAKRVAISGIGADAIRARLLPG